MRAGDLGGLSVTMPHKDDVAAAVDERSDDVERARRRQLRRRRCAADACGRRTPTVRGSSARSPTPGSTRPGGRARCSAPAAPPGPSSSPWPGPGPPMSPSSTAPGPRPRRRPALGGRVGDGQRPRRRPTWWSTPRRSAWARRSSRSTRPASAPARSSPTSCTTPCERRSSAPPSRPVATVVDGLGMLRPPGRHRLRGLDRRRPAGRGHANGRPR